MSDDEDGGANDDDVFSKNKHVGPRTSLPI